MKQTTFASLAFESKKELARRERFLAGMDQVVPWARLLKLIAPHYPKAGNGRVPMPLETMLRIYNSCSSGSISPTPLPRTHSTTSSRCAGSKGSSSGTTRCPTRLPSSTSVAFWNGAN